MNPQLVPGTPGATPATAADIAMVTVQMRVPEFWRELPRSWFCQFEAIMAPQKQGDTQKYDMVLAKLPTDVLQQVTDIIEVPPESRKYEIIKERLLLVYEESADKQFQKLMHEMDLGTQKPSQLLRKMTTLAKKCNLTEEPLKRLWLDKLTPNVRALLAMSEDTKLEEMAKKADKILETLGSGEVASITPSTSTAGPSENDSVANHLKELAMEMKELRGEINEIRNRNRGSARDTDGGGRWQQRPRSKSRTRRTPDSPDWLCRHHYRYRSNARTCEAPCSWAKKQRKQEN
ncbi:uncharacterized protein LOC111364784 [Spodoptera litura]|uniref:Uncharacterized protein LOC111364784 n=1 Tax=Spodoptera litura TaxID=69820 RepID=A0A9J7EWQ6_SPOLT|nr:uncharacterized protein LOC111364784 [Spodoptera litura]